MYLCTHVCLYSLGRPWFVYLGRPSPLNPKSLKKDSNNHMHAPLLSHTLHLFACYFQGASVPGQGFLNGIVNFITGPFGKGVTLIALVLCGGGYMFGTKSDNSSIARTAIGAAIIVLAANIFAYIQSAG